ncbi:Polyketide synthase module [Legionella erythra]|uniref:Polyketide synthase module n=2 Tax=Legionella erythra TaxID=448 RepID=A0A0W0TR55_LEGER|nr:Polyketide synthase module [Legionella erythra]
MMVASLENMLLDQIMHYAQIQPDKIAFKFLEENYKTSQTLTYGQLAKHVASLTDVILNAQQHRNLPLTQQPILLIFDSSLEYILAFLAVLNSGNIAITAYPPRQVRHLNRLLKIIENSHTSLVLTTEQIKNYCQLNQFAFPSSSEVMAIEQLQEKRILFGGVKPVVTPDFTAFLQYTSGSTGAPKGVIVTHKNMSANLNLMRDLVGEATLEKCISWLPIFHDMGLMGNTLLPLYLGGTSVFMAPLTFIKNPLFWLTTMSQEKGTYSMAPNFAYDLAADALENTDVSSLNLDFSNVRCLVNGAEPVKPKTVRRFEQLLAPFGLAKNTMKTGYGMAETTLCISFESRRKRFIKVDRRSLEQGVIAGGEKSTRQTELVCCGVITNSYQLRIVDPLTQQTLPSNQVGEIWVQGHSVASGYYNNPEQTRETFHAFTRDRQEGPFLRTGDLGFVTPDGVLIVCGRVKDLMIINGRNIYPQDIEMACYESDPALIMDSAAAFSLDNERSEVCVLIGEVTPGLQEADYQRILQQIKRAVFDSADIVPHDIVLIPPRKIFKTSSGKIQRRACKNAYLHDEFEVIARLNPPLESMEGNNIAQPKQVDNAVIHWLKQWISEQTKIPITQIDSYKAFADYGLSSVALVTMVGELEKFLQKPLDPWLVWEFPTISRLSEQLVAKNRQVIPDEETAVYEPIAIIGMHGLFPGKEDTIEGVDALWENLKANKDNITPIPLDRWDNRLYFDSDPEKKGHMYCSAGGFLSRIDHFDAKFFNISPREAAYLDPQQRLLLQATWHALEDAGMTADSLKNSKTGIYIGISTHDYDQLIHQQVPLEELNLYQATGTSFSTAAGRLAYFLGAQGPCMAIDTACSSSLVSIHQASRSLQNGDCSLAIAGGVNLMLSPKGSIIFCKSHMLSPRNRCSTFDVSADGYVRGEGVGIVILKKLADAIHDGNSIYAVIHGSAVNQDGASNGLTAPNLQAQIDVIQTALRRANLNAAQITHVEAHGTGTELGDPIEWEGIRRTYGMERNAPLYITSLKTRIGHLEAAAGVAGLIKTALAIRHGQIPAHLHLHQFNPKLHQQDTMQVPAELTDWAVESRYAGVSSFGFSGTNAHLILGEAPKGTSTGEKVIRPNHLWVVSAQEKPTLQAYLQRYLAYGQHRGDSIHFASLCHHLLTKRTHLPYRAFIVAQHTPQWVEKLQGQHWEEGVMTDANAMAWLFTGQGCLQPNVAAELYTTLPPFAAVIDHCCARCQKWLPYDLKEILLNTPSSVDINHTQYAQPALFVYEYALAQWLLKLGLRPRLLLGHSLGEYVAACIAEIMSLDEALSLVCQRAMLFSKWPGDGAMLAIAAEQNVVESLLKEVGNLVIALKNGPGQMVVSGTNKAIAACERACQDKNLRCKKLATSHAFHSPLIEPVAQEFRAIAEAIHYRPAKIPVISNVTGVEIKDGQINGDYWCRHMLQTVEFHQGLNTIQEKGTNLMLEISPKPVLVSQLQDMDNILALGTVSDARRPWPGLLTTLGRLFLRGVDIHWQELDKHQIFVDEPLLKYPFNEKQYWLPRFDKHPEGTTAENNWKSCLYQPQWERLNGQPHPVHAVQGTVLLISRDQNPPIDGYVTRLKETVSAVKVLLYRSSETESLTPYLEQADHLVYLCLTEEGKVEEETAFMMQFSQELLRHWPEKPLFFLTTTDSLTGAALLALLQSVKQEYPAWPLHCLQIDKGTDEHDFDFIFSKKDNHGSLRYRATGDYEQKKIIPLNTFKLADFKITPDDVCLMTGASGDIGQALLETLSALGLQYVVAVGRRENEPRWSALIQERKANGLQLHYCACDVSNAEEVKKLLKNLPTHFPPLTMIIHAAGTTVDKPWLKTTEQEISTILKAKALGAWSLHQATVGYPLKAFICISSISALFGNEGQALYAAANAYLNALVSLRRSQNLAAQSLILGPVKNTGLFKKNEKSLTAYLAERGVTPLTLDELQTVFKQQLDCPQLIVGHFSKPLEGKVLSAEPSARDGRDETVVRPEDILTVAQDILCVAAGDLSVHDNWFEAGMDSIMAAQLAHQLNRKYNRKCLTAKDIFTDSSAAQLAKKIHQALQDSQRALTEPVGSSRFPKTTPLSLQQQEIWNFLKQSTEKEAYQLPIVIRIDTAVSSERLQKALSQVLARHDVLRCSFHEVLGQVSQHIHDECELSLDLSRTDQEAEVAAFFSLPFDLTQAPLIRTKLIKQDEGRYLWLLNFHHLIGDGYTVTAFIHETLRAYEGEFLDGKTPQYREFIAWQWDHVYPALQDSLKSYWYQKLKDIPVTVPFAKDTQTPMEAHIVSESFALQKIKHSLAFLEKHNLSISNFLLANLFDVLLAAFQLEQLGIVVFFSGRQNSELTTVFGDTSNDVVITSRHESDIFTHSQLLQEQILSLEDKQYFRLSLLKELGLNKPMISFDFQRGIELNLKTSLPITIIKTSNVQNYLWGDEPRLLSFKVSLAEDHFKFALKYRADKITKKTAQTLLQQWLTYLLSHEDRLKQDGVANRLSQPASALQTNLWQLLKNHPNGLPYSIPLFNVLNPSVDIEKLNRALQKTIQDNPALRLSFSEKDNNLQWQIHPEACLPIQIITPKNLYEALNSLLVEPIDAKQPPLLKAYLLVPGQDNENRILFFKLHHLVCDGIGAELFLKALEWWYDHADEAVDTAQKDVDYLRRHQPDQSSYRQYLKNYGDYMAKTNTLLSENDWLPWGSQEPEFISGVVYKQIPQALTEKILTFCQKNQFSSYAFYFHMFCRALSALIQQETVYISLVKSNRLTQSKQAMIDYYADNIPVVMRMHSSDKLVRQIKQTQMTIIELIEQHQYALLTEDMKKMDYRQPPFIFNQYKAEHESRLFQSADYLVPILLEQGGNQVTVWNYPNPEKLNLLVRSSQAGDRMGLAFNPRFFNEEEAGLFLQRLLQAIESSLD